MTPPPQFSDLPPNIAKAMMEMRKQMQGQLKLAFSVITALATGLVGLAYHCLSH